LGCFQSSCEINVGVQLVVIVAGLGERCEGFRCDAVLLKGGGGELKSNRAILPFDNAGIRLQKRLIRGIFAPAKGGSGGLVRRWDVSLGIEFFPFD
jgi:hypothetical protein